MRTGIKDNDWTEIVTCDPNVNVHVVKNLVAEKTYSFAVSAENEKGESEKHVKNDIVPSNLLVGKLSTYTGRVQVIGRNSLFFNLFCSQNQEKHS